MRSDPRAFQEHLDREDKNDYNQELFQGIPSSGNRGSHSSRQSHGRNRNLDPLASSFADDSSLHATRNSGSYGSSGGGYNAAPALHNGFGNYPVPFNTSQYNNHATSGQASRQTTYDPLDYLTNYPTSTEADTRSRKPSANNTRNNIRQLSTNRDVRNDFIDPGEFYNPFPAQPRDDGSYLFAAGAGFQVGAYDDDIDWDSYVNLGPSTCDDYLLSYDVSDPPVHQTGNPCVSTAAKSSPNDTATHSVDDVPQIPLSAVGTARAGDATQSLLKNAAPDLAGNASQPLRPGSAPARSSYANVSPRLSRAWQFIASDADDQPLILQQTRAEIRSPRASSAPPLAETGEQINNTIASNTVSTAEVPPTVTAAVQQPTNVQHTAKVPSSTNVGATTNIQPSLTAEDFANVPQSTGFQTDGQPFTEAQLPANVQQSMAAQITLYRIVVSKAFSQLDDLKAHAAQYQNMIYKVEKTLKLVTPADARPLTNDTTSIDLSRDPRPGAKVRLAAQNASENPSSHGLVNPADIHAGSGAASFGASQLNIGRPWEIATSGDPRRSRQSQISPFVDPSLHQYSLGGSFDQSNPWLFSDLNNPNYQGTQDSLSASWPMSTSYASTMKPRSSGPSRVPNPGMTNVAGGTGSFSQSSRAPVRGSGDDSSNSRRRSFGSSQVATAGLGEVSASRRPSTSSSRAQNQRQDNFPASRQPLSSNSQPRSSGKKASANARPSTGTPTSNFFGGLDASDDASFSAHAPASRRPRQAPTNQTVGRRRKSSLGHQAAAFDNSAPRARATVSSRANGPSDAIEGMLPGAGAERLLGLQRASLPKGNVDGLPYSCEAKCGYSDYAVRELINCDSAFHRKQPHLTRTDGLSGERGWYHPACGGLPSEDFKSSNWICPPCVSNGRTSTDDHDYDEGGDSDHDDKSGSGGGEDSEDDYKPDHDNSDDDSNDEDGGNDDKYDEDCTNDRRRRNKDSNSNKGGNTKRYASHGEDDEGENDDDVDNQSGYAAGFMHNQGQHNESGSGNSYVLDADDESEPEDPDSQTAKGDPWSEHEKALAIYYYRKVDCEKMFKGEARFGEVARLMRLKGFGRNLIGVKNMWNRCLRGRSGLDERRNQRAPLCTSKQDKETKRRNREKKKEKARLAAIAAATKSQASVSTKSASPKREYESDDEDEVIPPKRRRASPYDGDRFPGLS
jgi:hypothetical protein